MKLQAIGVAAWDWPLMYESYAERVIFDRFASHDDDDDDVQWFNVLLKVDWKPA